MERPDDLTAEWLTAALGAGTVERFAFERIGTGQMSECYRVSLSYADGQTGPESVVLKVAASDPVSRQTGLALGLYEREVRFYTDIAPGIGGPVAPCYSSGVRRRNGHVPSAARRCRHLPSSATRSVAPQSNRRCSRWRELGRLHAPLLGKTAMADVGVAQPRGADQPGTHRAAVRRVRRALRRPHRARTSRGVRAAGRQLRRVPRRAVSDRVHGLVHGDYRLDNMLFGQEGADRPLTVVDWQTVTWGPAMIDVAYFLGCALPDDMRRDNYDALLRAYHDALGPDPALSLERRARRRSPPKLLRRDDGDRLARCSSSAPSVATRCSWSMLARHCSTRARHRRTGDPARTGRARAAAAVRRRRGRAPTRRGAAVERELVLPTSPTSSRASEDGSGLA